MARRVVVALLGPVRWVPPGINPDAWRAALGEDVIDLIATMSEVEPAIAATAADHQLAEALAWPGMPVYEVSRITVDAVLTAAAIDGFDQAAVVAADAPDLPGLVIAKLLRPLTSRALAVAPAAPDGVGLLGVAARLPAPRWLPDVDLDGSAEALLAAAPHPTDMTITPPWRRLRGPADLAALDPALEGWDNTRLLLSPSS